MRTTTFVRRRSCQTFLCLAYAGCGAAPCLAATDFFFFFFFTHRLRDWLDHLPFGMIDFVRRKSERLDCGACSVPPHTQTRSLIVSPSLVHNRLDIVLTRGRDRPVIRARIDPAGLRLGSSVIHSCSGEFSSLTFGSGGEKKERGG